MRAHTRDKLVEIRQWLDQTLAESEPGLRLPTMRELMRRFHTAQRTIELALEPYLASGQLQSRRGRGIVVMDPNEASAAEVWEGDLLVLYRISDSPLAHGLLQEMERRLSRRGHSVLQIAYSSEQQALTVLAKMGRFRTCLLQVHFELLSVEFLSALSQHVGNIVIDGVSVTGIDADSIGTNWREALSIAFRRLVRHGHQRIGFLTSAHDARQIAMARREFGLLSADLPDPAQGWLLEIERLPGNYEPADLRDALAAVVDAQGHLPFTALIVWGVVEGYVLENALRQVLERDAVKRLSIILLGSTDVPSEHMNRYDVVGSSQQEKLDTFEAVLNDRMSGGQRRAGTVYLNINTHVQGSVREAP